MTSNYEMMLIPYYIRQLWLNHPQVTVWEVEHIILQHAWNFAHLIPCTRYTKRNTCIMDACNMLLISAIVCGNTGEVAWQSRGLHEVSTLRSVARLLISDFFNVSLLKQDYRRKVYRVIFVQGVNMVTNNFFSENWMLSDHYKLPWPPHTSCSLWRTLWSTISTAQEQRLDLRLHWHSA